ncbi:FUSC family protein [Herminiimonas fonticola]|uniref:Putative membrane protein YccC n=1 Tax=Herminiimonas fonticola TaxID=303380 RepID=A0A4R6G723_9BURK|nr:FUSC family protein [Herminiimonas fonticola]RBA24281.1 putative membrane protein [Herminiimonas fonticola]TDN90282.1 putative membrane protein YccC [Herminiimonas fonticola]
MSTAAESTSAISDPATSGSAPPAAWHRRARVIAQDWIETEGQRWVFVLKTMLAAFLALWIAFRLGFDSPRSAMMTVFIVALPSSGMALEKSIYRLLGTLIGCAAALTLFALFPQQALLLFIALAVWVGLCTAGSALMRNARSYGFVLAGYTACMIAVPAIDMPLHVFDLAVSRVTEISLGILCAALVNDAIFPKHQSEQLVQAVRKLYRDIAQLFHDAMQGRLSPEQLERQHLQFATEVAALELGRAAAFFEAGDVRTRNQQLYAFNSAAMIGLTTFHTLHQLMQRLRDRGDMLVPDVMHPLYAAFSSALMVTNAPARNAVEAGVTRDKLIALNQVLPQLIADTRSEFLQHPFNDQQRLDLDTALELMQRFSDELFQLVSIYHDLPKRLSNIQEKTQTKILAYSAKTPPMIAIAAGLRSAAALLLLALAWYGLNWPSASGAVIITVIFCGLAASSPDPSTLIRQTTLGFSIALPFAFICAFFMLNHVEGYAMLVLAMLPFLIVGAYVSTWRKVAGIGIGFNLMFAQMISPENLMRFDVIDFINSGMAQIIGLMLAALMFALILPEHKQGSRRHIAEALWDEAWRLCISDARHLRHHFESSVRDLLNQLSMSIRGTADAATRMTLNQAITLLELGHAIIDLRDLSARLAAGHPARIAKEKCVASLADYFRRPQAEQRERAIAETKAAGKMLRELLSDGSNLLPQETAQLQRALTDLHLIHTSLLDQSLSNFSVTAESENGALHAA